MAPLTDSFEPEQQKKRHSYRTIIGTAHTMPLIMITNGLRALPQTTRKRRRTVMTRLREPKKRLLLIRRLRANVATLLEQRRSTSLPFSDQTIDDSFRSPERNSTHIAREISVKTRPPYEPWCASSERLWSSLERLQIRSQSVKQTVTRHRLFTGSRRDQSKTARTELDSRTLKVEPTSDHLFTRLTAAPDPPSICPDLAPPRSKQPLATVKLTRDRKYVAEGWNGKRKRRGRVEGVASDAASVADAGGGAAADAGGGAAADAGGGAAALEFLQVTRVSREREKERCLMVLS
ncbi:LOW QUALITY PROTEIN: hypothetical protein HID58_001964 [Brassica napus]|uniref:Uncharacterized protein n=1 Tax=Brassica napus TaxID=3708 RepID=A0ABQ8EKW5_BRANA|nr:LOW QUALITY PROTEIN: hypothetical protein HID58_001964 [Brassica napus]